MTPKNQRWSKNGVVSAECPICERRVRCKECEGWITFALNNHKDKSGRNHCMGSGRTFDFDSEA